MNNQTLVMMLTSYDDKLKIKIKNPTGEYEITKIKLVIEHHYNTQNPNKTLVIEDKYIVLE